MPTAAPVATPSSLPAVTAPANLQRLAEVERDGVRLTLELESTQIQMGVESWATMTGENVGAGTVFFMTDGCEVPVQLLARLGGGWIGGAQQLGIAAEFKALALRGEGAGHAHLLSGFMPEQRLGRAPGCADTGIPQELTPGKRLTQRSVWWPWDDAPMPAVPVTLEASFPFAGRGRAAETADPIVVSLDSWIASDESWPWMTPAQAVDAALADPVFFAWLLEVPSRTWINASLDLDTEAGIWQVGLFRDAPTGVSWAKLIQLDAATGQLITPPATRTRPIWREVR
jgi:hypothetical protein